MGRGEEEWGRGEEGWRQAGFMFPCLSIIISTTLLTIVPSLRRGEEGWGRGGEGWGGLGEG